MDFTNRTGNDVCIVGISGNIALDGVNEVKDYVKPLLEQDGLKALVINFENVNFIDSAGIGLIVSLFKSLQQRGGKFALCSLSEKNQEIFNITRLNKILDIYGTEAEALSALG